MSKPKGPKIKTTLQYDPALSNRAMELARRFDPAAIPDAPWAALRLFAEYAPDADFRHLAEQELRRREYEEEAYLYEGLSDIGYGDADARRSHPIVPASYEDAVSMGRAHVGHRDERCPIDTNGWHELRLGVCTVRRERTPPHRIAMTGAGDHGVWYVVKHTGREGFSIAAMMSRFEALELQLDEQSVRLRALERKIAERAVAEGALHVQLDDEKSQEDDHAELDR